MSDLSRVNLEGFIFRVRGGEYVTPHSDPFPGDAYDPQWDPETRTLSYKTPNVDAEGEPLEPTEHTKEFTETELENAKTPPATPAPVPQELSRREFHLAAASVGITRKTITDQITLISDATQRNLAMIDYEESRNFRRDWPLLSSLAGSLNVSESQLDDLFRLGRSCRNTPAV